MTKPKANPQKAGRPPIYGEPMVSTWIRLPPAEAAKLRFLGRDWLIARLKKVPPPPNPESTLS